MHLIKIYKEYGRLTVLITRSMYKVIPFIGIFMLWDALFAVEFYILDSNMDDVDAFEGVPKPLGYIFLAF